MKFLHGEFARRADVARRFENEARAAGEVEHENIAAVYDVGALPDGTQYLVMEFLDGEDLDRVLKRELRVPLARAADIIAQTCHGLDVVHRRGIVHRDLKPANLFITKRASGADLVKVLDFGIAKLRRLEGSAEATKTGAALGTAYYMSPEQARGEKDIGARSDIYALGVIFYELLSGQRPHDGDSLLQILHRILTQPPRPLEEACPGLPGAVYGIVRTAMAPNAADRFADVGALAAALAPFGGAPRVSNPPSFDATRPETAAPFDAVSVRSAPGATPRSPLAASVVGVARNAGATGTKHGKKGVVIGVSVALALAAIGAAAFVFMQGRGGGADPLRPRLRRPSRRRAPRRLPR